MKYMFAVTSENKTYATANNAEKAFLSVFANNELVYIIVKLDEHNCTSPKYFGRFIPVALGHDAIKLYAHFQFYVMAF